MKTSEKIEAISKALVLAQKEMVDVVKNSENPFLESQYADLPAVLKIARPTLSKHGIAVIQFAENPENKPTVITRFLHESGEWIETELSITVPTSSSEKQNFVQKLGSVITYLRRYEILAMCAMGAEDEDGANADSPAGPESKTKTAKTTKTAKEYTLQDRIDALPIDLKDLFKKAGAVTFQQQYQVMKSVEWNVDAAKKACLKQINNPS